MVISLNTEPHRHEFEILLNNTLISLKNEAKVEQKLFLGLLGNKLESKVFDTLNNEAKGTAFDGSIELVSGQRFPDIVAKKYYGIEVKTTKSNHWKSTGSSVAEGTRVKDVERIFMMFGKMCDPVEFMCKPYEDCLSEVVVTHSPRYLIDMNLKKGETIFDKIKMPYDTLRKQDDPIKTVLSYYKSKLKEGESTWWFGESEVGSNMIIRLWNHLDDMERNSFLAKGFCLFPELLGNSPDKFNRFALWLATQQSIVCPNVRDQFTAGGQGEIEYNNKKYIAIPRIIINLSNRLSDIKNILSEIDLENMKEYWNCSISSSKRYEQWCDLVIPNLSRISPQNFPIDDYLRNK